MSVSHNEIILIQMIGDMKFLQTRLIIGVLTPTVVLAAPSPQAAESFVIDTPLLAQNSSSLEEWTNLPNYSISSAIEIPVEQQPLPADAVILSDLQAESSIIVPTFDNWQWLESATEEEDSTGDRPKDSEAAQEAPPSPEETARQQKLVEGDRLYLEGDAEAASQLYREAKEPFAAEKAPSLQARPKPVYQLDQLPPGAAVFWQQYQTGVEQELESKIFAPLKLLVEQYPQYIPGHLQYAQSLDEYERQEEANAVLQSAIALYPSEPSLLRAKLEADAAAEQWLEASLAARQFALFNPDHPQADEFTQLAAQYLERYQSKLKSDITWNAVGNAVTGALGYALTGNLFGPISAIQTTVLLLQGESGIGDRYAERLQEQLPMVKDEAVLSYVREIGHKLTAAAGRDDFEYEFYVVLDDRLNAFALPGGKVFVHTGAIQKTNSEAELAGLIAHELSHAVLSHGFQLVTQGNLTANVAQFIPYGGTAANLLVLDYSRDMEREADLLGTRILAASGYAADGVRNLMVTLQAEDEPIPFAWLSTHPDTEDRVRYLEDYIVSNDFNRYSYEGVSRHRQIQEKVNKLWEEYKESEEYQEREAGGRGVN